MNRLLIGLVITLIFSILVPIGSINAKATSATLDNGNVLVMDGDINKIIVSAQEAVKAKDLEKAKNILNQLSETKGDTLNTTEQVNMLKTYAFIYYSESDYEKSAEMYKKILSIKNGPPEIVNSAKYSLAQLYLVTENWQEGVDTLTQWIETTHTTEAQAFNMLAQGQYQLKNYDESLINIEKAISMTKDKSKVKENWWGLQRYLYWVKKDYDKVEEIILTAYKYYPGPKYEKQLISLRIKLAEKKLPPINI